MKKQFAGLLNDIGFLSDANSKSPEANFNSGLMIMCRIFFSIETLCCTNYNCIKIDF